MNIEKRNIPFLAGRFGKTDLYAVPMDRFKTCSVIVFFSDRLSRENVTKNSMLPAVLRRGSSKLPDFRQISVKMEQLFGCAFECGVSKKGDNQLIYYYIEMVSRDYLPGENNIFGEAIDILFDIISDPLQENGSFKQEYVKVEKKSISKIIDAKINDKIQYSVERCFESMYGIEPFGLYEYGYKEDMDSIESRNLFDYYIQFMDSRRKTVIITGKFDDMEINSLKSKFAEEKVGISGTEKSLFSPVVSLISQKSENQVIRINEKMDVGQAKLCMGFRTGIMPKDSLYYPLLVCNSILGGGIHSKLFKNVREKEGLAYYVFSRVEKFKGAMIVASGINGEAATKAQELIMEQIKDIAEGKILFDEMDAAIKAIETSIKGIKDNQIQVADYYYGQSLAEIEDSLDQAIEKVKDVRPAEISEAASKVILDTVYLLSGDNK